MTTSTTSTTSTTTARPVGSARTPSADVLTAAEEVELARRIEAGVLARELSHRNDLSVAAVASPVELAVLAAEGERAFAEFVERNLALVGMVVRQEAPGRRVVEADLFQDGCLGLIEAVRRFDHTRGCRFATYGLFWVRAYVRASSALRGGALHLTVSRAERLRRARGLQGSLTQQLGREATPAEVGEALGRSEDWVAELLAHQSETSLDDGPTDRQFADARAERELESVLDGGMPGAELLDRLDPADAAVLRARFGFAGRPGHGLGDHTGSEATGAPDREPQSYAAIARTTGLSVRQVRRAEQRALEMLRGLCPAQARLHLS